MRVIGGELSGRVLLAPRGKGTRPTAGRVREAMFAALEPLAGLVVFDLYAGSGALAIEALSRGAERAVAVENDPSALAMLRRNLRALALEERCVVIPRPIERARARLERHGPADLVLVDPPYRDVASGALVVVLGAILAEALLVREGARLVIEHAARDVAPSLERARLLRTRRYGDTAVSFHAIGRGAPEGAGD